MPKIAILDDDPDWGDLHLRVFKGSGFEAVHHATPGRFFDSLLKNKPDLLVLDMQLPGMHGREVIRVLRANEETRRILIVAVSAHDVKSEHAVRALDAGADEYLSKPIDLDLLVARVNVLLGRGYANGESGMRHERLTAGPLVIMLEQHSARLKEKELDLTRLEFDLLTAFVRQADRVLTRSLILETVWNGEASMGTRTVDKHVESLRRKLGPFGKCLETVVRVGYVFKTEGSQ